MLNGVRRSSELRHRGEYTPSAKQCDAVSLDPTGASQLEQDYPDAVLGEREAGVAVRFAYD